MTLRAPFSVFWFLPIGFLWFVLINDLRVEWTVNPQYSYGWAVPFLCVFLAWQRMQQAEIRSQNSVRRSPFLILGFMALAFFYAPTRLIEEANPGWRLVSWALAIEVAGLTLLAIYLTLGARRFWQLAFPIGFFFVAVPWPTVAESSLIQGLTRLDTGITAELLGWFGIPAMPHGNVVEVATGVVGIDEACSGIRSFQATLMISLFLGEFYRLNFLRRLALVLGGFALSFVFNLARMSVLVWVAARKGVPAIAAWHDPAGVTILLACFFSLLGLGIFLARKNSSVAVKIPQSKIENQNSEILPPISVSPLLPAILCAWIVCAEIGIEWWYRSHEARVPAAVQWSIAWPTNNSAFKDLPFAEKTREILRYDDGHSATWAEGELNWQVVYLRWNPGRTAIHLAQNHTPDVCLTAAGHTLVPVSAQEWFDVNGLRMPFSINEVTDTPRSIFVFYCLWDDRAHAQGFETASLNYGSRLAPVRAGLRNPGQRSLEIALLGANDVDEAETAVRGELQRLVTVGK